MNECNHYTKLKAEQHEKCMKKQINVNVFPLNTTLYTVHTLSHNMQQGFCVYCLVLWILLPAYTAKSHQSKEIGEADP